MTYDEFLTAAKEQRAFALPVGVSPNVAGSGWTTIGDYYTFLERSIEDQAKHPSEYKPMNKVNSLVAWTLSWGVDSSLDAPAYFHWSDGPGVKNFTLWQPTRKTAVVVFANSDHGASAYRVFMRRVLGLDPVSMEWV